MQERVGQSPRSRRPWARRLEAVLWVVGLITLASVGWGWVDGRLYQARQERLLEQALLDGSARPPAVADASSVPAADTDGATLAAAGEGEQATAKAPATRGDAPERSSAPEREPTAARPRAERSQAAAGGPLLARLTVPRLDMSVMVASGLDSRTLRRAAGHIPGTAPLGSGGNVGLAGHRDSFFRPLRHVRVGDEIVLTTPQSVSTYLVEWTEVVTPEATEVLRPTPYPALTLVTCYPFSYVGTAPDRLVVRARLVESRAPDAPERVAALVGR